MAFGDWSFPRDGCSCTRFKTQIVKRPWIGAQLWPTLVPPLDARTFPSRYFLNVFQEYSATPIWSAQTFTGSWDISAEHYGDFSYTGTTPNPTIFNSYGIGSPSNFAPFLRANGTGNYVFSRDYRTVSDPILDTSVTLVSFTPAASTTIRLNDFSRLFYGPLFGVPARREQADFTVTRIWSNEFTEAMMEARIEADLENEVPHNSSPVNTTYPRNFVIPNISENLKPWARGGMVEFTDHNSAIGIFGQESNVPLSGQSAFDWDSANYGHAHRWTNLIRAQGYIRGGGYGDLPYPASISRCKIYVPGEHSVLIRSLTTGEISVPCQAFNVACPPESQSGELYILGPPEGGGRYNKMQLYLNQPNCATFNR